MSRPSGHTPAAARRLLSLLLGQGGWLALGLVGILLTTSGTLFVFLSTQPFINALSGQPPTPESLGLPDWLTRLFPSLLLPPPEAQSDMVAGLTHVVRALLVGIIVMATGQALQAYGLNSGVQRVLRDLRDRLFAQTTNLSLDYFEREQTGQIIAHLTVDIAALRDYLTNALVHFLSHPIMIVGSLLLMLEKSPQLTGLSFLVLPLLAGVFWVVGRRVRRAGKRSLESLGELSTQLTETIVGMPVVKAFSREAAGQTEFALVNRGTFKAEMTKVKARASMLAFSTVIVTGAIAWLLLIGMRMVEAGTLVGGAGALVAFMLFLYQFSDSLQRFGGYWTGFQEMLAAADRIFNFLDLTPTVRDAPDAGTLSLTQGEVRFEAVRFGYSGAAPWAIDGVDFTIPPGKTIALVGPSGSGKSSLAKLLLRFYDPSGGRILIDGQPITGVTQQSLRQHMAFVPQGTLLFSGTIASNIRFGKEDASDAEVEAAARKANAHEFIAQLEAGYATPVGERGITLSGGQAQRVAIARALLRDPAILILDEATSALDATSEQVVQEALNRLMQGRTTLVIAHRLTTIQDADQILVLDHGQIVQRGTHEELLSQEGLYRELYRHASISE